MYKNSCFIVSAVKMFHLKKKKRSRSNNFDSDEYSYSFFIQIQRDVYIEGTGFLSILPILLPTRESGIRRDKYLSAAIFKEAVNSDDP